MTETFGIFRAESRTPANSFIEHLDMVKPLKLQGCPFMSEMSYEQIMKSYQLWLHKFPEPKLDSDLMPFLNPQLKAFPQMTWLFRIRRARLLSKMEVAKRLGISRSTYARLEASEVDGKISLKKLSDLAEKLDCELVYALRPKNRTPLSLEIWLKLLPRAIRHSWVQSRPANRKVAALVAICLKLGADPEFRRAQGWTERKMDSR